MIHNSIFVFLRRTVFIAVVVGIAFSALPARAKVTDSLLAVLKEHGSNDTAKVLLLSRLSVAYTNTHVDSAIVVGNEGLAISKKIGFKRGEMVCGQSLGEAYLAKDEYDKALGYFNDALKISQAIEDRSGESLIYCYIGNVYAHHAQKGEAIGYYLKSLELSRNIRNTENEEMALLSMGNVYSDVANYPAALNYYLNALKIIEKEDDADELSSCLSNIADIYSWIGDYDRSLTYNRQSLELFLKTGNKKGVVSTYFNSGINYGQMNNFGKAIEMFKKGVALADSIGDTYWKTICIANLGEAYYKNGSNDTAYEWYQTALNDAEKSNDLMTIAQAENGIGLVLVKKGETAAGINAMLKAYDIIKQTKMIEPLQEVSLNLSNAYEKQHDAVAALKYYKLFTAYTDSLTNEKSDKRIQQLEFDYELGKKENQITLLEKEKLISKSKSEKQTAIIWLSLIGLTLLSVASLLLYRSRTYEKRSKEKILKQNEEILQQAQKLEELNEFKDKTFSVLSHDLRGPIGSFYAVMKMMDDDLISTEEFMSLKPEMTAQIASISILLDNLLKWASIYMKGNIASKPQETNIHNVVLQNVQLFQTAANNKQIEIRNEIPNTLSAYCDTEQIDIVIRNLLINAIKFTGHNGTINITGTCNNNITRFSIADNGVGMTPEQLSKLFKTTADNKTYGTDGEKGTGLGLLLCHDFVLANKGTITVTSAINKGTTFTVELMRNSVQY